MKLKFSKWDFLYLEEVTVNNQFSLGKKSNGKAYYMVQCIFSVFSFEIYTILYIWQLLSLL